MAASGYSPISLYYSTTASATPTNTNLVNGELALNITDGKLFYKDNAGTVQTLATKAATSGSFSTTTISTSETLSYGTANGVAYLNGSKVLTTGSALTFDGTNLNVGSATFPSGRIRLKQADDTTKQKGLIIEAAADDSLLAIGYDGSAFTFNPTYNTTGGYKPMAWWVSGSEQMRLTSTGLGIGTSSPVAKLHVKGATNGNLLVRGGASAASGLTGTALSSINDAASATVSLNFEGSDFNFVQSNAVKATLDSSGNLGLGVTPSAWWSSTKAIQVGAGGVISGRTDTAARNYFASNAYLNSTPAWTYISTNFATRYEQNDGQHQWFNAPSGTAGNAITFTQAMTLDASGTLGLGTTSPTVNLHVYNASSAEIRIASANIGLQLYSSEGAGTSVIGTYTNHALVFRTNATERARIDSSGNLGVGATSMGSFKLKVQGTGGNLSGNAYFVGLIGEGAASNKGVGLGYDSSSQTGIIYSETASAASNLAFWTYSGSAWGERARIDSSGNLLVGTTSSGDRKLYVKGTPATGTYLSSMENTTGTAANAYGLQIYYSGSTPNGAGNQFIDCVDATTVRFRAYSNGGLANYSANNVNLSDRREKTNFAPAGEYLSKICAIPVQTFNYIDQSEDDPGLTLGVVAQDVQVVAPELVSESNWGTEEEPKMRLSIYQTDLQYALMKALQELKAEFDAYKATHP